MTGAEQEATGTPRSPRDWGVAVLGTGIGEAETSAIDGPVPTEQPAAPRSAIDATRFAHASEAEMARILDFYQVRWEYEPTTFPILWNLDGDVVESFAPDFYLPDLEVFLEMTTLRQRLVRKKNRKLRRLRELYPDIRIKLFYARDFRAMMLKYGRLGLAESLSGTTGQVVPERRSAGIPVGPGLPGANSDATLETATASTEAEDPGGDPAPRGRRSRRREARIAAQAGLDREARG